MHRAHAFLRSTLGLKIVMALTGLVLFAFVIGHMIGNLQVYVGAEALNAYGAFLRRFGHGGALWAARALLRLPLLLHARPAWRPTRPGPPARRHRHPSSPVAVLAGWVREDVPAAARTADRAHAGTRRAWSCGRRFRAGPSRRSGIPIASR